jgi:hypothetical protein
LKKFVVDGRKFVINNQIQAKFGRVILKYKSLAFDPPASRSETTKAAASDLNNLIEAEAAAGWRFVGLQNHSTVVPGSNGCFGFGATGPYQRTISIAVFEHNG